VREARRKAANLSHIAGEKGSEAKRQKTKAKNRTRNDALQKALEYKTDHRIDDRARIIVVEKTVHVKSRKKYDAPVVNVRQIDSILDEAKRIWLRQWVRKYAVTKEGSKTLPEIRKVLIKEFPRLKGTLNDYYLTQTLHYMGIQWQRLKEGYYQTRREEPHNVFRRGLLLPLWRWLMDSEVVVVWTYDQCKPIVKDFYGMGWVDTTDPDGGFVPWKGDGSRGISLTVSAFQSKEFGLLVDEEGGHVGCLAEGLKSDADVVAEDFAAAADLVTRRWPQYLHVFFMDSPSVSSWSLSPIKD